MVVPEFVDFASVGASIAAPLGALVCGLLGVCVMLRVVKLGLVFVSNLVAGDTEAVAVEGVSVRRATADEYEMNDYDYTVGGESYVDTRYEEILREQELRLERKERGF